MHRLQNQGPSLPRRPHSESKNLRLNTGCLTEFVVAIIVVQLGREGSVKVFLRIASAWIVVCLIAAASSYGMQNSPTAGTLGGTIVDVSGAFVPGAMIM